MSVFEQAAREKLRFGTVRGNADVEKLWDMPLEAEDNYSLDAVGTALVKAVKAEGEESLVKPKSSPGAKSNQLRLDIVKHIINVKLAEIADRNRKAETNEQLAVLETALSARKTEALNSLSEDELQKRINELKAK